jgi:hypothetical protein
MPLIKEKPVLLHRLIEIVVDAVMDEALLFELRIKNKIPMETDSRYIYECPIYKEALEELISRNYTEKRIRDVIKPRVSFFNRLQRKKGQPEISQENVELIAITRIVNNSEYIEQAAYDYIMLQNRISEIQTLLDEDNDIKRIFKLEKKLGIK